MRYPTRTHIGASDVQPLSGNGPHAVFSRYGWADHSGFDGLLFVRNEQGHQLRAVISGGYVFVTSNIRYGNILWEPGDPATWTTSFLVSALEDTLPQFDMSSNRERPQPRPDLQVGDGVVDRHNVSGESRVVNIPDATTVTTARTSLEEPGVFLFETVPANDLLAHPQAEALVWGCVVEAGDWRSGLAGSIPDGYICQSQTDPADPGPALDRVREMLAASDAGHEIERHALEHLGLMSACWAENLALSDIRWAYYLSPAIRHVYMEAWGDTIGARFVPILFDLPD